MYLGVAPEWKTIVEDLRPLVLPSVRAVVLEGAMYQPIQDQISTLGDMLEAKGFQMALKLTFDLSKMARGDVSQVTPQWHAHTMPP